MPEKKWRNSHAQTCGTSISFTFLVYITNQPNTPRIMKLTSLLAVAALPWAAARTANVRGSQEEHQSVHRAVKENDKKNPKDWRESASISSSPTLSFEDYTMDGCGNDPCGQCAGDCDRDTDCEGDLICFQREDDESVAGCRGAASSGWAAAWGVAAGYTAARCAQQYRLERLPAARTSLPAGGQAILNPAFSLSTTRSRHTLQTHHLSPLSLSVSAHHNINPFTKYCACGHRPSKCSSP